MSELDDFKQAMQTAGLNPPAELLADGTLQRFASGGDSSKNSWYILFAEALYIKSLRAFWITCRNARTLPALRMFRLPVMTTARNCWKMISMRLGGYEGKDAGSDTDTTGRNTRRADRQHTGSSA